MPRIIPGPPCVICKAPSVAHEMCDRHYRAWKKYGDPFGTARPITWGQNNKHPLWQSWKWTKRLGRVPEWNDFWVFVEDVGERPSDKHRLRKRDTSAPAGPGNCYWKLAIDTERSDDKRARAAARAREWRKQNPTRSKGYDLKKKFGIGIAEYDAMFSEQNGGCAICGKPRDKHFRLAVDHDHATGEIRGLLCADCNRGLGLFADNPERLRKAADYLTR